MVTETKPKNLKLSNWQVFLLGKLYNLYLKGSLCDVTLKFSDNVSIQAHKVVLTACTTFFDQLPSSSTGVVLHMPTAMKANYVKPIINFMYSGRLEYMAKDQKHIFSAAKHLGMTVLTELLQVQETAAGPMSAKAPEAKEKSKKNIPKSAALLQDASIVGVQSAHLSPVTCSTPVKALPGKRLPIWKKRTAIKIPQDYFVPATKKAAPSQPSLLEIPKPTRFDWPEDECLPDVVISQTSVDSFEDLSYDTKVIVKPVYEPKPVILADSIEMMPVSPSVIQCGGKRVRDSEVVRVHCEEEDYYDGQYETSIDQDDELEGDTLTAQNVSDKSMMTPPKPILKSHETVSPSPSKKVRFSLSSEKYVDGDIQRAISPVAATPLQPQSGEHFVNPIPTSSDKPKSIDHAKIINEILNKYSELVKNNKNIKLKIQSGMSPQGSTAMNTVEVDKDGKVQKKVRYVVLKSDFAAAKKEARADSVIGAENRSGPWFCIPCGKESGPVNFESYYNYRKHLQEVHNQKIDARICEHCGFKASKRNLHLYHLYTKHNIPPPRNINFPKCDQCDYIALSESLLMKHRNNHTGMANKEYVCRLCNATFKNYGALMGHMQTNLHFADQATKKDYECEYCGKLFNRNINLKAHIRTSHPNESRKVYDDEERVDDPPEEQIETGSNNIMEVIEVPVFESVSDSNKTLYLPPGMTILAESPSVPLMPSSESEAMNNVATGIATSINLTDRNIANDVIVIDGSNDIILRGAPTYVLNPDGSYSVQEYIVPDMLNESGQVYTALVSSAPATGISYVTTDNLSLVTSASDHTYADGVKINGHVTTTAQGPTVIASQVQVSQSNQPIIVQEPIIMSANWVQSIAGTQMSSSTMDSAAQTSQPSDIEKTTHTLVSDWGDLEDDGQEEAEDGDEESDIKPSRPTIELNVSGEMDI